MFLWVPAADKKVALVRAGAAPYADVHEELEGTESLQPLPESFQDDLFPVGRQFPVFLQGRPLPCMGKADVLKAGRFAWITINPGLYFRGPVHPPAQERGRVTHFRHFLGFHHFVSHVYSFSSSADPASASGIFSTGSPTSIILSLNSSSYSS
jgi:hypothetical protein